MDEMTVPIYLGLRCDLWIGFGSESTACDLPAGHSGTHAAIYGQIVVDGQIVRGRNITDPKDARLGHHRLRPA